MAKIETGDDIDGFLHSYIEQKLAAKGISQEEAVRSLDYYVSTNLEEIYNILRI